MTKLGVSIYCKHEWFHQAVFAKQFLNKWVMFHSCEDILLQGKD